MNKKIIIIAILAVFGGAGLAVWATSNPFTWTNGLVGYWPFDGQYTTSTAGTTDVSGNGGWGTFTNGVGVTGGISGQAAKIDGVDDYVSVADKDSLDWTGGGWSVEAWVFISGVSTDWVHLIDKGNSNYWLDLSGGASAGKEIAFYTSIGGNWSSGYVPLPNNEWHHVVGVGDDTAKTLKIYLDGRLGTPAGSYTGSPSANTGALVFGALAGARYANGMLDEIRMYNRVLSADEVMQHYQQTRRRVGI